jgi:hypothetical protein
MRSGGLLQALWLTLLVPCALFAQNPAQPSVCSGWKAWRSYPPSGPPILHVAAHCELPTPGHKVELVPATPQGSDATVLVLNELLHAPEGVVAQVITPFELHYKKRTRVKCKEVVINPEGTHVPVAKAQENEPPETPNEMK